MEEFRSRQTGDLSRAARRDARGEEARGVGDQRGRLRIPQLTNGRARRSETTMARGRGARRDTRSEEAREMGGMERPDREQSESRICRHESTSRRWSLIFVLYGWE